MKLEMMQKILDSTPGVRKDGAAYLVPDEIEVAVFIGLPSEVLTVPRCARIEAQPELLILETHKNERYCFALADVAGVKSSGQKERAASRATGFR
jgi:hypothetical protein